MKNPADLRRRFWALFLESRVEGDGQVPGFDHWWQSCGDWQRRQGMRYAHAAAEKIIRDGRLEDECLAAGVRALREALRAYIPPRQGEPPSPEETKQLVEQLAAHGWEKT